MKKHELKDILSELIKLKFSAFLTLHISLPFHKNNIKSLIFYCIEVYKDLLCKLFHQELEDIKMYLLKANLITYIEYPKESLKKKQVTVQGHKIQNQYTKFNCNCISIY